MARRARSRTAGSGLTIRTACARQNAKKPLEITKCQRGDGSLRSPMASKSAIAATQAARPMRLRSAAWSMTPDG
jgi:hypothetical protein